MADEVNYESIDDEDEYDDRPISYKDLRAEFDYLKGCFDEERNWKEEALSDLKATEDEIEKLEEVNSELKKKIANLKKGDAADQELKDKVKHLELQNQKLKDELKDVNNQLIDFRRGETAKSLDDIINCQVRPHDTTGLGFVREGASTFKNKGKELMNMPVYKELSQNLTRASTSKTTPKVSKSQFKQSYDTNLFFGNCYFCGMYGHRMSTCKFAAAAKDQKKSIKVQNKFDTLYHTVECYSCGEIGHMAAQCYSHPQPPVCARDGAAYRPQPHTYVRDRPQQKRKLVCYNCNNEGHTKRDCKIGDLNLLILRKIEEHLNSKIPTSEISVDSCQPVQKVWQRKEKQIVELSDKDDASEASDETAAVAVTDDDKDDDPVDKDATVADFDKAATVAVNKAATVDKVPQSSVSKPLRRRRLSKEEFVQKLNEDYARRKAKKVAKEKLNERRDDIEDDNCYSDCSNRSPYYGEGRTECLF